MEENKSIKILRASAIVDLTNRFKKVIDKISDWKVEEKVISEQEHNHIFAWKGDLKLMSLQDYGKLCEIAYIIYKFEITKQEIEDALKLVGSN